MNILYIGDIMAESGIKTVEKLLPTLRKSRNIDFVIAQGENVSNGRSILEVDMKRLQKAGVDFFSGGNHTPERTGIAEFLLDEKQPIIGPANLIACPGKGYKIVDSSSGKILVASILGDTFSSKKSPEIDHPLHTIDRILKEVEGMNLVAKVVNFHGDYSSQKKMFGHYLDGRVTAVIGDHWHIPTADAHVLDGGTAYITDVGMCGSRDSSLGMSFDGLTQKWLTDWEDKHIKTGYETEGVMQLCSVIVSVKNGLATSIEQIIL